MISKNIGYIILEGETSNINSMQLTPKTINGKVVGKGILQTANERNRNGRWYCKEELFPQLKSPRIIELLETGTLIAQCGHPIGPGTESLQVQSTLNPVLRCARFLQLWTEGMDIWGEFVGTNNDLGLAFDADLKEGIRPAWSLRALGSIEETSRGAEVHNLKVITWDSVYYPSHTRAYTQGLVYESVVPGDRPKVTESKLYSLSESAGNNIELGSRPNIIPVTNESVIDFVQNQSHNMKFVKECCDFMYDSISVNESGSKAILRDKSTGDTIVINLESYVHNEIMNYAAEMSKYYE